MRSSSDDTRLAVNARDTSLRRRVCFGGSVQMIMPVSRFGSSVMVSTVVPCDDTYVSWSLFAASMSWKRVSTQKSYRSLCQTGASSRIRFQSGYGSSRSPGVNGSQYRLLMVLPPGRLVALYRREHAGPGDVESPRGYSPAWRRGTRCSSTARW